jgi:DNA helicase-2/ATP-dependent DNA helicase PcrA
MDVSDLIGGLNEAQREAVSAPLSNQLVLAGAGSGKTRVLVHRIAWLIRIENLAAHQILAVTFTNKAAHEMRERLSSLLGESGGYSRHMWVGTFHGLAHRLLRSHWQEAGLPQNFQILDSDDQLRLIKRIYQELQIDDARWPHKQAQWFINGQKDEGIRAAYLKDDFDPFSKTMKTIYHAYEEACKRGGLVDFAELLLRSHELWLNNSSLLEHYQRRFKMVLVDEFQDTNSIQYAWLRVLTGSKSYFCVVGDDDQRIYGWRGAKIENIQRFEKDFAPVSVTRLEQNYRSTSTILSAANAVIQNNGDRLGKTLWTDGAEGEAIDLYAAFNEQDEARYIVDQIKSWMDNGHAASEMAILYRSNAQSRVLEEACIRGDLPYRIYGGQRFYERMEIKNALAYMRLLSHPNDDNAFERVVNTPTRGIGNKTLETLRVFARDQGCSLHEAAHGALNNNVFTSRAANALKAFLDLVAELKDFSEDQSLEDICNIVLERSGLIAFHEREKGEKGQARVENLKELVSACRVFEPEEDSASELDAFLDRAALDAGEAQADDYEEAVQMMTLHSAKGLEFPFVVLAGMEENLFPHKMSSEEPGRLEEERRLCYVGITRAMQKLVLTHAESRRMYGSENFNSLSRFVREIPNEFVKEVRMKATVARTGSFQQASLESTGTGFQLGQSVRHAKYGEGVILQVMGEGARACVEINFESVGTKMIMLQYASLEAV